MAAKRRKKRHTHEEQSKSKPAVAGLTYCQEYEWEKDGQDACSAHRVLKVR
jgi:hypothetical protein